MRVAGACVTAWATLCLAGPASAIDPFAGATTAPADVTPAQWAEWVLAPCAASRAQTQADDDALAHRLETTPVSREQAAFLARERQARTAADNRGRTATIGRLNALLFGEGTVFGDPSRRRRAGFVQVMDGLLHEEDVCAVEAIEGTALLGLLGLPLDEETSRHLRPDREFELIAQVTSQWRQDGATAEQIYERLRPRDGAEVRRVLEATIRAAVRTARRPDVVKPVLDAEGEARLQAFLTFVRYASEPLRVQFYLQGRVDAVEGALGTQLMDGIEQRLFDAVRRRLYASVDDMRRLEQRSPEEILALLEPIIDHWFRSTAAPRVRRSLSSSPFAAYWYFVRTGGAAAPGPIFRGSRTTTRAPAFSLHAVEHLTAAEACQFIRDHRVPATYAEAHAALEAAFTNVTLTRDEILERIATRATDAGDAPRDAGRQTRLRAFLLPDEATGDVSTLDIYARIIRDASLIRGRLDWSLAREAMLLFVEAKADRVEPEIQRLVAATPTPGLESYLRTAAALMSELERRQVSESAFKQGTAGAAVGWLLSRFFISGHVPVQLWAPGGLHGRAFVDLVNDVAPKNRESGANYHAKAIGEIALVHDGREYHDALVRVIDSAERFLNISSFDWKTDAGGREIAYRLMAKKLGLAGEAFEAFERRFADGLPIDPTHPGVVPFYDIPSTRIKDLLVTHVFETSEHPDLVQARTALREAGASLACETVRTCGDLSAVLVESGRRYTAARRSPAYDRAWSALHKLEALFADGETRLVDVRPRAAIRDYIEEPAALRRFVRRFGLRRSDRPGEPFPINIVADAKQNLFNLRPGERSEQFPWIVTEPIRDIYFLLLEFDIRVLLWKGAMEFPWHLGALPVPGRNIGGVAPMPFVPWPWLNAVPGFGWAGVPTTIFMQYLLATDVRVWWGMVNHTKSWSHESLALESGMGMGLKYFNQFERHRTWHDMGVLAEGAAAADVNDHFVQVFNEARVNNRGLPGSRGVKTPRLRYADYVTPTTDRPAAGASRVWVLTTHPEQGDSNYRGVLVAALAAARQNIYIENSFFSDPLLARLLMHKAREFRGRVSCEALAEPECAARMRDAVQIYLVLPDSSDKPIVDAVGTSDFHDMLRLGIKVHRWHPESGWSATRMLHSKVWLIDYQPGQSGLAYVGAANATQRSHLADNEAGILSDDPGFARQVYERVFEPDMTEASRLESGETFRAVRASNSVVRTSRWLRRLLVELFWFI